MPAPSRWPTPPPSTTATIRMSRTLPAAGPAAIAAGPQRSLGWLHHVPAAPDPGGRTLCDRRRPLAAIHPDLAARPPAVPPAAVPPAAVPPAAVPPSALYDARRRVYYAKPALRGWLHAIWFGTSLAAGPLLVYRGHEAGTVAALAVYAASVSGLFGISALYHRGSWSPPWSARLQRMDHLMI